MANKITEIIKITDSIKTTDPKKAIRNKLFREYFDGFVLKKDTLVFWSLDEILRHAYNTGFEDGYLAGLLKGKQNGLREAERIVEHKKREEEAE